MTLRKQTLVVIGATLAGLLVMLYTAARLILLGSFANLEEQDTREDVQRAVVGLSNELEALDTTARDYAAWDDTYAFVADGNPKYVQDNFPDQSIANLNLNLILIVNTSGQLIYGTGFDTVQGTTVPVPPAILDHIGPSDRLMQNLDMTGHISGTLLLPAGPLLVVARPILTSAYQGPIRGTLVMGRYLNPAEIQRVGQIAQLSLAVGRFDDPQPPPDFQAAAVALSAPSTIVVRPLSPQSVAGYALLNDPYGKPALILRVDQPRTIYQQGQASVSFFLLSLLVAGLVFGLMTWLLLERYVLSRLAHLSRSVSQIGASGNGSLRVALSGRDELASLAAAINEMLAALAQSGQALRESEEKFRKLAQTSPAAIVIFQGPRVRYVNAAAEAMTGYSRDELLARPIDTLVDPESRASLAQLDALRLSEAEQAARLELRIVTKDGQRRWLDFAIVLIEFEGEAAAIGAAADITERKQTAEALSQANEKLLTLVDDLEQRTLEGSRLTELSDLLQACPTAQESYGVIGRFAQQLLPAGAGALYIYSASRTDVEAVAVWGETQAEPLERVFAPDECWALERGRLHLVTDPDAGPVCRHLRQDRPAGYLCVPILARGEALGVLHVRFRPEELLVAGVGAVGAVELKRRAENLAERIALSLANVNLRETLRYQSIRDPLTGLFNRRYMQETLERELHRAERNHGSLAVLMLDLDHFKRFNDAHGHDGGDALLRELGNYLMTHTRGEDIACRYGGEEFTLILPDASSAVASARAEELRAGVKALQVRHYGQTLGTVTLSLGVAVFPLHGTTGEMVLRAADRALYRAKQAGRDRVGVAEMAQA